VIPRNPAAKKLRRRGALTLRGAFYFFLAAGILALGYAGYVVVDARAYQAVEKTKFESASRSESPRIVAVGGVIGELEIPSLGLDDIFVQGDSPRILRRAVGHVSETALPGEEGNVVLTAHRDTFFRPLRKIRQGDRITLKTSGGDFQYRVESTAVVSASDVQVLQASDGRTLTLITCFPFYYVGSAPDRFIVRARQIESQARSTEQQARLASDSQP
jgi:sortase A